MNIRFTDNGPIWLILMVVILVLCGIALSGCSTVPKVSSTVSLKPVCTALGPPHVYNRHYLGKTGKPSPYYAASKVAPRLHRDNRVGTNLRCPGYK